jgi:hypothetical protein
MQNREFFSELFQGWRKKFCLTNLSNRLFVYVAGEVIPTIPPEIVVQTVKT